MKHVYREGPEARRNFDKGMVKLFGVPKSVVRAEKPKLKSKRKKSGKN